MTSMKHKVQISEAKAAVAKEEAKEANAHAVELAKRVAEVEHPGETVDSAVSKARLKAVSKVKTVDRLKSVLEEKRKEAMAAVAAKEKVQKNVDQRSKKAFAMQRQAQADVETAQASLMKAHKEHTEAVAAAEQANSEANAAAVAEAARRAKAAEDKAAADKKSSCSQARRRQENRSRS